MGSRLLKSPFRAALIFVCHSCEDHKYSDYIAKRLSEQFQVWYSCAGSMLLADPIVPREELVRSDLVLLLGSRNFLATKSVSAAEFSIAQILRIKGITGLAVATLEDFRVPPEHSDLLFERFRWSSRSRDMRRIEKAISKRLARDVGFTTLSDSTFGKVIVGGKDLEYLLDAIKGGKGTPFLLNAAMRHLQMTRLIEGLDSLGKRDLSRSIEFLRQIYFDAGGEALVARQNVVFILGKLA